MLLLPIPFSTGSYLLALDFFGAQGFLGVDIQHFRPKDAAPSLRGSRSSRSAAGFLGTARGFAVAAKGERLRALKKIN